MTVATVAVFIAVFTLLIQKTLTDNRRLLEAKRRAGILRRRAQSLPAGAAGRALIQSLVTPIPLRSFMASLLPIGVLLGPMVLPFIWFAQRIDPRAPSAPAGSAVQIVASIDSAWDRPITLRVPTNVTIDAATAATRTLPPIRPTLEHLLRLYRQPGAQPQRAWELELAPDPQRAAADDLEAYLEAGIPPQGLTWLIRPPAGFSGRLKFSVEAAGEAAPIEVVIGDTDPPSTQQYTGEGVIRSLKVVYPKPTTEASFLRPLGWVGSDSALAQRLGRFDLGWIGLYIVVYLPALLAARAILKVA
jgi:hypothetical protein